MSLTAYYVRVYVLLALVALGVTLIGGALVMGLNAVREQAFLERHPEPLMTWLAANPDSAHAVARLDHSARLRLIPMDAITLNDVAAERLGYGQVLADRRGDAVYLYYLVEQQERVLELRLQDFYRGVAELSAFVLVDEIRRRGGDPDEQQLLRLSSRLGVLAEPLTEAGQIPDSRVLDRVLEQGQAYHQPDHRGAAHTYARIDGGQLIEIRHMAPFRFWSWPMIFLVGLAIAGGLAVTVYYLLSNLHRQLRSIEGGVTRIARGELEARVPGSDLSIAGRLGDAFNRMADHIQRLVTVQREMIHGVSHELRTPVARIRFGVQMIEDCDDPETLRSQLAAIDRDIQELDELIDEILTYARLEQGGPILAVERVNVVETVEQVIEEQQSMRPDQRIEAEIPDSAREAPWAEVEPRYLHRAIQNLVGNATRYARERVLVSCQFDEQTCRIDVQDDGEGVPEQDWDKVFTAFARLDDSRTRKSGGYGLGLSIVRRILYWHGGQAFVGRSETLGGACFTLVWPRQQARDASERSDDKHSGESEEGR